MRELISKTREYLDYIEEHYNNVQRAWEIVQEKCKDMRFIYDDFVFHGLDAAIRSHDESKLSKREFVQYRQKFFPVENEVVDPNDFKSAWNHHKSCNDHHWQKWVELTKNDNSPNGVYADFFVAHNAVDWIAMSLKFGDTAREYYEKNKKDIDIPDWADALFNDIFDRVYGKRTH